MPDRCRSGYEAELLQLQAELTTMTEWVQESGARVVVVFEGRDAAGKGGVIKRISEYLSPRMCRTVALPAPTERERSQWYFQRYVAELPAAGEIVLFDRSWYNRAGVEHVMGFCTSEEYHRFLRQCPVFEHQLIEDGIILVKYWFSVSDEEQERRFQSRVNDPLRRWKLSRSTWRPASAGPTTRGPRTPCSCTPTPPSRHGTWSTPRTSGAPGSTASPTCSTGSPTRPSTRPGSSSRSGSRTRATGGRPGTSTPTCPTTPPRSSAEAFRHRLSRACAATRRGAAGA